MSIYEMAKSYYEAYKRTGQGWSEQMLHNLVAKRRLTPEQYEEITGVPYDG